MTTATDFANSINQKFRKQYGRDVILPASDERFQIKRIPTGILAVDCLTGGGFPMGRWTEIYGDESLMKTSIAMMAMAETQRMGFPVMYCNVERNVSQELFKLRGVDTDPEKLFVFQTDIAEEYVDTIKEAMANKVFKMIVIDSISALYPRRESDSKKDATVGAQALLTSRMGRVLTASNDNDTAFILINQTREKIGISFGDNTTRSGGKAPRFYDSMTIRLTRIGSKKVSKHEKKGRGYRQLENMEIAVELEKTKAGGKMGAETVINYNVGKNQVDEFADIMSLGAECGLIEPVGRSVMFKGQKITQKDFRVKVEGSKKFRRLLKEAILKEYVE